MIRYVGFWGEGKTSVAGKKIIRSKRTPKRVPNPAGMGFFNPLTSTQIFAQPGNPNSCRISAFWPLCYLPHKSFPGASPLQSFVWTEILPRDRCVNHVTSYAYLSKNRLNALSAAIWPYSHWKKVPIKWFSCHQNHFSRYFWYLAR